MRDNPNISIEMIVHCHNFQRRLAWVLSSIHQQRGDLPRLVFNIASMPDNGSPRTEDLVKAFHRMSGGYVFDVKHVLITNPEIIAKRGITRNVQLKVADAHWIYFADADNVFPPNFFAKLKQKLLDCNEWRIIYSSTQKNHTEPTITQETIDRMKDIYIPNAYEGAAALPTVPVENRWCAPGCMQIIRHSYIKEQLGNIYVNPRRCRDFHMFREGQRARSDIQFRKRVAHTVLIRMPRQIHLNHIRDKELGHHYEGQR